MAKAKLRRAVKALCWMPWGNGTWEARTSAQYGQPCYIVPAAEYEKTPPKSHMNLAMNFSGNKGIIGQLARNYLRLAGVKGRS